MSKFQQRQQSLISAASLMINEQGLRATTLTEAAGRVGLAKNSVSYYFHRKEDLAAECFLRSIHAIGHAIETARERGRTPEERIATLVRAHAFRLSEIEGGSAPPLVVFHDIRALSGGRRDEVFEAYTDMFRAIRQLWASGSKRGPETNMVAHLTLSLLNGMRVWFGRYDPTQHEKVADRLTGLLLGGVAMSGISEQAGIHCKAPYSPSELSVEPPAKFLTAATRLINEQGYRGASVDRIAASLGLTKGGFYSSHPSKDELVLQCFHHTLAIIRSVLEKAERSSGRGVERLAFWISHLVAFQHSPAGPLLRRTAFAALPDAGQRRQVMRQIEQMEERISSLIVDGMIDGSIRPMDPCLAARALYNAVDSAGEYHRWSGRCALSPGDDEQYAKLALMGISMHHSGNS